MRMRKPKDLKRWLLSGQKTGSQGGVSREMKVLPDLESLKLCSSLDELPLADYIHCSVTKDYTRLIISGKPTENELFSAWIKLQSDFYEAVEDKNVAKNNKISSKVNKIKLKIAVVTCLLDALNTEYKEDLAEELRLWGFKISENTAQNDLKRVEILLGNEKLKAALALKEYSSAKEGGEVTKKHFMKVLLAISKHRGQHYKAEQLSTYEFALMYLELQQYSETLKQQQHAI